MVGEANVSVTSARSAPGMDAAARIGILSDGKRGHENQTRGLAEAMGRRIDCSVTVIELPAQRSVIGDLGSVRRALAEQAKPDVILAAGHRTHPPLLAAGWWTGAGTVVLMRPTLPGCLFDLCLVPRHDLPSGADDTRRRLVTEGAINRMRYLPAREAHRGLILIGGPSREHGWDGEHLLEQIRAVTGAADELTKREWTLTDSRRTPNGFRESVSEATPHVQCFSSTETEPGWLPTQLTGAAVVWVTADSVSMMYEALTAGARVGVLDMPLHGRAGKISRTVDRLVNEGWVTRWTDWRAGRPLADPPRVLNEADRCAAVVIERFGLAAVNRAEDKRRAAEGRTDS